MLLIKFDCDGELQYFDEINFRTNKYYLLSSNSNVLSCTFCSWTASSHMTQADIHIG